ncbi:MAG: hypothetical protein K0R94_263 [Burkholderiales bacterium]|jgi:hypothetical protein|nr:hypothetical protein [Burkholderiales bacterium]
MDKSGKIMLDKRINLLYKDTYYDMLYVNENTEWEVLSGWSSAVKKYTHTKDKGMEALYNILKSKFPGWKNYNELFTATAKTKESHPDNERIHSEQKNMHKD